MSKQYISHRRASIMNCELIVDVHCRQQFRDMTRWLVDNEYKFSFEVLGVGDSFNPETYRLTVENIHWANNLVEIARQLTLYDYDSEGPEEGNFPRGENPDAQCTETNIDGTI